jgi:hypothetical protein
MAAPKRDRSYAVVGGQGSFPLDMLRYDRCFPMKEAGPYGCYGIAEPTDYAPLRFVLLGTDQGRKAWTPDRWRSFGWCLAEIGGKEYPPMDEELEMARREINLHFAQRGRRGKR